MTLKSKIQENFNRAALTYDSVASIQKRTAQQLLDYLKMTNAQFSKILDIGTGTGFIPEILLTQYPNSSYILNDISPAMVTFVSKKFENYSNIAFHIGDAEQSVFPKIDLTVSNMAFQWFENLEYSIKSLWKDTTIMTFSTLMEGTFSNWSQYCHSQGLNSKINNYPSYRQLVDYCNALNAHQAYFYQHTYTSSFNTPLEFMRYLKLLGANTPKNHEPSFLKKSIYQLNDGITANYNVFYAVLIKLDSILKA